MVAHASSPETFFRNARIPTKPLIAAPMPGKIGINQIKSIGIFLPSALCPLPFVHHRYHRITLISSMLIVSLLR